MKDMNSGYYGNKMSKNALHAHKMNQFPLSALTTEMLKEANFTYSLSFFKWLCKKGYIKPIAVHHTGVSAQTTCFYSPRTLSFVAMKYRLPLLYDIYLNKVDKKTALSSLGITYCKIKTLSSLLGIKPSAMVMLDVIRYKDYYFISKSKWICPMEEQVEIISEYKELTGGEDWNNSAKRAIERKILIFKDLDEILKSRSVELG